MEIHETEAIVAASGSVSIHHVPFSPGEHVRVFVMAERPGVGRRHTPEEIARSATIRNARRGTVTKYVDPDEPVALEDWDALGETEGTA